MKRFLTGILLTVVFYFVGCMVLGGVAGGIAGAKEKSPQAASAAGARAGAEMVLKYRAYILVSAVAFGVLGPWVGLRPARGKEYADALNYESFPTPTTTWP